MQQNKRQRINFNPKKFYRFFSNGLFFPMLVFLLLGVGKFTQAQTFTSGNVAVFVAAASSSNTTGNIVELNTVTSAQSPVNTYPISGTGASALRFSGSATSTLYLANSNDGTLLAFTGANNTDNSSNVNTLNPRAVGTFNANGTLNIAATYSGSSGNQTRGVTSLNNTNWYIGDQGGFYTNGSSSASPSGNIRSVKAFGGTVYAFTSSASAPPVGIISATTGGTYTALAGLGNGATSRQDFYLISSGSNGSSFDVLYVMDATSGTAGTIFKYSLVSGSWTANGSSTTSFGGFGIAAKKQGTGAYLFVTTGTGASTANSLIRLTDAAGYNATISITTANNVNLYTTSASAIIKGVAFAPVSQNPTITGAATATAFSTTYGTPSAVQNFTVSGINLTAAITATAPTGFEVSNDGISYAGTATFAQSGGTASGTLRIRLAQTAPVTGAYNSKNITLTSTGATTVNISTSSSGNIVNPKSLTITGVTANNKIYDGGNTASLSGTPAYSGLVNGESFSVIGSPVATFASVNAGNGIAINVTGYNAPSANYTVTQPAFTANISPATLTITGASVSNKEYDGNNTAIINGSLNGVIGADDVIFNSSGTFAQSTAGTAIAVTSNSTLSGAQAGNYTLTQPTSLIANITKKPLTITGIVANNKTFDGNTTATLSGAPSLSGVIAADVSDVTISGTPVANFAQSAAGSNIPVAVTGYSITGSASVNYSLTQPAGLTANITAAPTPVITSALTASATYGTVATTYIITATNSPTSFNATGLPAGLNVNMSNGQITGTPTADPGNYNVTLTATNNGGTGTPATLVYTISQKQLDVLNAIALNKEYDRTNTANILGDLDGIFGADDVTFNGTGMFAQVTVGTGIPITSTATLTGTDAYKYTFTQLSGLAADITPKNLIVIDAVANNKLYDGNNTATINVSTLAGVISPDNVTVSGNGTFVAAQVGNNIPVTGNLVLSGTDAFNYTVEQPSGLSANITPASLTITGITAANKVYDGGTLATLTGMPVLNGIVGTDNVIPAGTPVANFNNKNVGTGKTINVTGYTIAGADAGNYRLSQPSGITADITWASLTIAGATAQNKNYDGNTNTVITGTLNGIISPDVVNLLGTGNFATASIGMNIPVTSTSTLTGADAANYLINPQPSGLTANILAVPDTLAKWTYEPLQGTNANPTPNVGSGSSSLVGSMTGPGTGTGIASAGTGCGAQTSGTTAWAIATASPGANNESSGVQFNTSTAGHQNIKFSWDQRSSNTAVNTVRLQYTTNGTMWTNFNMTPGNTTFCLGTMNNGRFENNSTGDQFRRVTVDLSSVSSINNNSNFGVRIVAAYYQTTTQFRQTATPTAVATSGTWRFDNVYFAADLSPAGSTAAVLTGSTTICNDATANLQVGVTGGTPPYTVVYTDGTNNFTINNYTSGTAIPVTPAITTTYTLVSVTDAANGIGAGNSGSATVTVNGPYTITTTSGANGSVTPAGASTVNCGDNATYTITPAACYAIADVLVDGTSVGAVGTYTFTNVTANHTISATFVQTTYTITATSGANGSVTPAGASTVNCGDNATYTITPAACYAIADVLVDGTSVGAVGTYTFTNVTANHTISATFVQTTYTITATSGANGSVTPAGASTVNCGDNATYTITPAACYAIADVLVDGTSVGAVGTYTFTNVMANHTISATFVQSTYTITATSGANGSVTPAGASTVNCGDNATYTITPAACYAIADVLVDGTSVGAVGTYTFTNVTANHTISATFVQTTYTITATSGANGSVTPAGASTVNCGDNATYTITPAACYAIADVLVDGTSVGAVGTYTFTNVTANHTISATFVQTTYTITATSGANGTVTPAGASTVNCGANATYTITPAACYAIADVLVDGTSVGAVGTYTFTNVTANHTISATFVQTTYTITATSGANGTVTPAGASTVNCGDNATYTITPAACYAIADVLVDGTSVGAVGTYTFTNVTANHTISATFVQTTYTITATSGANGTVTPAGASTVNCGANATYTITPNAGYAISNVIVDGASVGAVGTYTFTNVTANHTISATFVATGGGFTITSGAGANGTISPNGVTSVPSGGSQSYTMTPAACYHVQNVLVDGTSVGAVSSYTFTNVTANHTISVSFAINAPLTVSVSGPVNVCPYVGTGEQVTYTATSAGATGFTWVTPPNVNIVSGQGTANLVVTFGAGFTAAQPNKQLKVTALSPCGNSTQFIYYLAVQTPTTPQPIVAGSSDVCAVIGTAGTITYTIPSVSGASSYNWSAQAGTTTITHPNGLGVNDTTVNVSFTNGFSSSNITVSATSPCATSGTRSLLINRNSPSTPGLISGPTNACEYIAPNGTPATYSVNAVATATSYTWTYPAGAIGVTGQGTNSISFTYPAGFTSGTVTVTATNGCGTSGVRSLTITKLNPATPSVIDVIQTSPCPNRVYTYTLSAMPSNATSVLWTVPAGGTIISGQGTTSITVSYAATAIQGNVTAQGVSNCGTSATRISAVKLAACPAGGRPVFTKTAAEPQLLTVAGMEVSVFPNPTTTDFKLQIITAGKEAINVRILDLQGRSLKAMTVQPHTTVNIGSDLKAGAYMIEVRQGQEIKTTRVLKF